MLQLIRECGYANVPKNTSVKEEPTAWHFVVRIPGLPIWRSSRAARLTPADRVRELQTHMIAAYEGLERDFLQENAERDVIQAESEDAMRSLA